jgi:AGCS family alanine or glycine:cation symporter
VKYRVRNENKGYDGGPMYYLQKAFNSRVPSYIVCVLFCIYGVEVLQFTILSDEISHVMKVKKIYVVFVLLCFVFFSSVGGVKRLANLCSAVMPPFLLSYFAVGCCIFYQNFDQFLSVWPVILDSALNGHAAVGGFAATSMLAAAQHGTSRAVYSGDIGIGYDSILQSETSVKDPAKQARIAVIALFSDTLICTISCLIVLVTGVWTKSGLMPSRMIPEAVSMVLPHSDYFMLLLLFVAGVTTITAYFVAGMKCAKFISKKYGEKFYIVFGMLSFLYFSQYDQTKVLTLMSLSGGLLVFINLIGILTLRRDIVFNPKK